MGLVECVQHGLLVPFPVLHAKSGELVAQIKSTVLLMPNGSDRWAVAMVVGSARWHAHTGLRTAGELPHRNCSSDWLGGQFIISCYALQGSVSSSAPDAPRCRAGPILIANLISLQVG